MSSLILKTKKISLLLGDVSCLYLALYATLFLRYGSDFDSQQWDKHFQAFSLIFMAWLIVFFIADLYDLKVSYNNLALLSNYAKATIINGIIAVLLFYFLTPLFPDIKPQRVLIIDIIFSAGLLIIWRKLFYNLIKSPQIANRVLLIGVNDLSQELLQEINKRSQLGYQAQIIDQLPDNLKRFCINKNIDTLVSSEKLHSDKETARKIFDCLSLGIDVYNISGFYELIAQKIPVKHIEMSWFLENLSENTKKSYEILKRMIDIFCAIIGLILTIPLVPFIALIIKLESRGPIIFKQIRTGKNGKEFLAMKFRSMINDAEKNGAQWAAKNDARVTRFGRLMRMTRLDEIPQLINILRGEMSLVGPRPERPEFIEMLSEQIPFYRERLLVLPGLAGWAQLMGPAYGGSTEETLEKLQYDLYYVKNRSLMLDLSIILKTIRVVLSGRGQ